MSPRSFYAIRRGQALEALGHSMDNTAASPITRKAGPTVSGSQVTHPGLLRWSSCPSENGASQATGLIVGNQVPAHLDMSGFNGEHSAKDAMRFVPGLLGHRVALCIGFTFLNVRVTIPSRFIRSVS